MSENFAEDYYFIDAEGSRRGPISESDFVSKIRNGEILPDFPVWRKGEAAWAPLKDVREKWFSSEAAAIPSFERLPASTGIGSVFSAAWEFLFAGNHFWLLLGGGILWTLIESALSSFPGGNLMNPLVSSLIVILVFLIFVRKWDRGETPVFADTFPLKSFFFLPWLRALGATVLSGIAVLVPIFVATAIVGAGIAGIWYANPELRKNHNELLDKTVEVADSLNTISAQDGFPQLKVETEHESDEALPEVENVEVFFPDNASLSEEIQNNIRRLKTIGEGYSEIAETVFESPIFWIALVASLPFVGLAVFLSVRLVFAAYFPLDANIGVVDALSYSWKLTAGKFRKIFIFGALLSLFLIFGALITFGFGFLVLYPYCFAAWVIFYVKLIKSRTDLPIPPSRI